MDKSYKELYEKLMQEYPQPLALKPNMVSFNYYKGFYDATYIFTQLIEKMIDLGVINGTKTNTDN